MAETKDNGGPAFPVEVSTRFPATAGMSLRDYFAGQALAGFASDMDVDAAACRYAADRAYRLADAMLAERKK